MSLPSTFYSDLLQTTWPAPRTKPSDLWPQVPLHSDNYDRPHGPDGPYCIKRSLPLRFEHPELVGGYQLKPSRAGYTTSNSQYGQRPLTALETPSCYHQRHWKFWDNLYKYGMYRNYSPNTKLDSVL